MITKAIERAYKTARLKNWDKIYWAIDLHETCLVSSYGKGSYRFINQQAANTLLYLSQRPETVIILWSSVHADEEPEIIKFFADYEIRVHYFNHNPEVENTAVGNFDTKFYFNVLVDDKAGFDYRTDWVAIRELFELAEVQSRYFGTSNPFNLQKR